MINTDNNALVAIIAQLQDLLTWPENWNTYNAKAPNPTSISIAQTWITTLYHHIASQNQHWIAPNITSSGDGDVVLSWRCVQRKLTMYVDGQDIDYVQVWGSDVKARIDDGDIESIDDMQRLWQWLLEANNESKE
jgi:hypothetical protein